MLVLPRVVADLLDFGCGDIAREYAANSLALIVNLQHDTSGSLPVEGEELSYPELIINIHIGGLNG